MDSGLLFLAAKQGASPLRRPMSRNEYEEPRPMPSLLAAAAGALAGAASSGVPSRSRTPPTRHPFRPESAVSDTVVEVRSGSAMSRSSSTRNLSTYSVAVDPMDMKQSAEHSRLLRPRSGSDDRDPGGQSKTKRVRTARAKAQLMLEQALAYRVRTFAIGIICGVLAMVFLLVVALVWTDTGQRVLTLIDRIRSHGEMTTGGEVNGSLSHLASGLDTPPLDDVVRDSDSKSASSGAAPVDTDARPERRSKTRLGTLDVGIMSELPASTPVQSLSSHVPRTEMLAHVDAWRIAQSAPRRREVGRHLSTQWDKDVETYTTPALVPHPISNPSHGVVTATSVKLFVYDPDELFMYNRLPYQLFEMAGAKGLKRRARVYDRTMMGEQFFTQRLLADPRRVRKSSEADLFVVPFWQAAHVQAAQYFSVAQEHLNMTNMEARRWAYETDALIPLLTHWNINQGADHVFHSSYDYGICKTFTRPDPIDAGPRSSESVTKWMHSAILGSTYGDKHLSQCFRQGRDTVIPPGVDIAVVRQGLQGLQDRGLEHPSAMTQTELREALTRDDQLRTTLVHFRGQMVSIRGVRAALKQAIEKREPELVRYWTDRGKKWGSSTQMDDMLNAQFCLCPAGHAPWSPRPFLAAAAGCIPVIVSDDVVLPFEQSSRNQDDDVPSSDVLQWDKFSVRLPEADIPNVYDILSRYTAEQRIALRTELLRVAPRLWLLPERLQGSWGEQPDAYELAIRSFLREYNRRLTEASTHHRKL